MHDVAQNLLTSPNVVSNTVQMVLPKYISHCYGGQNAAYGQRTDVDTVSLWPIPPAWGAHDGTSMILSPCPRKQTQWAQYALATMSPYDNILVGQFLAYPAQDRVWFETAVSGHFNEHNM